MSITELIEISNQLKNKKQESKTVDAKSELDLKEEGSKAEFVKDVAAMANNAVTSYIVIGLQDSTFESVGFLKFRHKKADLNQLLIGKVDPPIVIDYDEFMYEGNEYALVEIKGQNPPYIIGRDMVHNPADKKRVKIYKGMIYVRHEDRTEGISRSELNELLQKSLLFKTFETESSRVQQLVTNKPSGWEFYLTAELLSSRLQHLDKEFNDLNRGVSFRSAKTIKSDDVAGWVQEKLNDLIKIVASLRPILEQDIYKSWGEPGVAGNEFEIKQAVDKLTFSCREMLHWELALNSELVPKIFQDLKQLMQGWAANIFHNLKEIPNEILDGIGKVEERGVIRINVDLNLSFDSEAFDKELEIIKYKMGLEQG